VWPAAATVVAGLGLVSVGITVGLPWRLTDFVLGPVIRVIMALAGAGILILAARPGGPRRLAVRATVALLGVTVLLYPSTLGLAAAELGGSPVDLLARAGHVIPLVSIQLLPVLASQQVTGRSRRGWLTMIIAVAVVGLITNALVLAGAPGSPVLGLIGSVLWLGSFAFAPVATWAGVRGTSGEVRRRTIVAALSSVVPVVIIAWCMTLGAAAETQGLSTDASVTALMTGFSLGTTGTAALVMSATGPEGSWLLRTPVIVRLLAALLVAATALLATGVALGALEAGWGAQAALLIGIALTLTVGLVSVRLHGWAARAVDPSAELAGELRALGDVADGEQRHSVQQVLRRLVGDPGLVLLVRANDGVWVDPAGVAVEPPSSGVRLAGTSEVSRAVAVGSDPETAGRLRRLGDCSRLLDASVLEASVQRESARADHAAGAERVRLSQDLHDGLQGRLLGIALNLQLSGLEVDDPAARLLVDQTVASLRVAVDDVRSLAGGRLPSTLVEGGLRPALSDLVRPLATVVDLRVSDRRFAPEIEATGYFVVSEAVSNAIKHGRAQQVRVRVEPTGSDRLLIMVTDDGTGGADPRLGSGLRGLSERVAASGGLLVVRDGVPSGTVVEASLPCGS
jgi:signal transduction histidine kinase